MWIRITKKLVVSEYKQPDISLSGKTKYWLKKNDVGNMHTTSFGNSYVLFNFEIFDCFLEPTEIVEQNLTCREIADSLESAFGNTVRFSIEDSNGLVINRYFGSIGTSSGKSREAALIEGIIFMKEYGQFHSWEAISLAEELKEVKEGRRKLWKKYIDLKEKMTKKKT